MPGSLMDFFMRPAAADRLGRSDLCRAGLLPAVGNAVERLRGETSDGVVAVVAIDLDDLAIFNAELGWELGDALIGVAEARLDAFEVSHRGREDCRVAARPGGGGLLCLIVEVFDGARAKDLVLRLADEATDALSRPISDEEASPSFIRGVELSAVSGVAMHRAADASPVMLLKQAQWSMRGAKLIAESGAPLARPPCLFFDHAVTSRARRSSEVAGHVHTLLEAGGLVVHLQPKVDLQTGEAVGAEALVRLRGLDGRLLMPGEFIGYIEDLPLMASLSREILGKAVDYANVFEGRVPVAVNIPAHLFGDSSFLDSVHTIIDRQNYPGSVELEVVETRRLVHGQVTTGGMDALAARGVRVYLDDFGTGYASFDYLRSFPFAGLKIDRSFVAGMTTRDRDRHVVRAAIEAAKLFGVQLVAEGVESAAIVDALRAEGARIGQGFHLARPMDFDAFSVWLQGRPFGSGVAEEW